MPQKKEFVNIAAYKFVRLDDLHSLRNSLRTVCREAEIKGTILLSVEGINLFLAGTRDAIDRFVAHLLSDSRFADIPIKESLSDHQPFRRMLVKLKKEIISFGVDGIDPSVRTSPKLKAQELKAWLDEGRDVTLLDVRNDYEFELGTFRNATTLDIDHFRQFPAAVKDLPEEEKQRPIVMFCTGGIRCEKAGPFMEREGFENIYQLDGGILKYFEECGSEHYDGECFVFDHRVALDSGLEESETTQCYACQHPLTAEEQQSDKFVFGETCPYCYRAPEELMAELIDQRHAEIKRQSKQLPGSVPYDNIRPMNVPSKFDGETLLDFLDGFHPHVGRDEWTNRCHAGRLVRDGLVMAVDDQVVAGQRIEHMVPNTIEPDVNANIRLLFEDDSIVVVNKPAPIPMHPSGRFNRNTLIYLLNSVFAPTFLRIVHRLDANTSGVVVLAKKASVARTLQKQLQEATVTKTYIAIVEGHPDWDEKICDASINADAVKTGARLVDNDGVKATTELRVVERLPNGTSRVEAIPITGRTNQIRVHLAHLGFPIVGDKTYGKNGRIGDSQTHAVDDPPLCLHARSIRFAHPISDEPQEFVADAPDWYTE